MRKLVSLFLLTLFCQAVRAQNFMLGVPIYDTIKTGIFTAKPQFWYLCPTADINVDTNLVNLVTGVNYYLLITSSTLPKDSLRRIDASRNDMGPVNTGDSFLITNNNAIRKYATYSFSFGSRTSNGQFSYAIMASGTPTNLKDTFVCKEDYFTTGGIVIHDCGRMIISYSCLLATCEIREPFVQLTVTNSRKRAEFSIYPTLAREQLHYKYELSSPARLQLFDGLGRVVRHKDLPSGKETGTIDVSTLTAGVYYYRVLGEGIEAARGRVVLQQ